MGLRLAGLLISSISDVFLKYSQVFVKYLPYWRAGCGADTCRAFNLKYFKSISQIFSLGGTRFWIHDLVNHVAWVNLMKWMASRSSQCIIVLILMLVRVLKVKINFYLEEKRDLIQI